MAEKSLAVRRAEEPLTIKPVKFESLLGRMDDVFNNITNSGQGRVLRLLSDEGQIQEMETG